MITLEIVGIASPSRLPALEMQTLLTASIIHGLESLIINPPSGYLTLELVSDEPHLSYWTMLPAIVVQQQCSYAMCLW